jgi:hypothetical protein
VHGDVDLAGALRADPRQWAYAPLFLQRAVGQGILGAKKALGRRQSFCPIDPFADVWDRDVVPLLRSAPKLKAITLLRKLQEDHPERFPDSMRRTLERHISQWRALEGPNKEVFFPQTYPPGARGLSDAHIMIKTTLNHEFYSLLESFGGA